MALDQYNEFIALFESNFKPILNNVQQSDKDNLLMIRSKMESFSRSILRFGDEMTRNGEEMKQGANVVDVKTDLEIFIQQNKTEQPFVTREVQVVYDEAVHGHKGVTQDAARHDSVPSDEGLQA